MGIVRTTHPFSSPRHRRYRRIGWRSRPFCPHDKNENASTTHTYSSARRHLYSDRSTGGPVRYSKGSMGGEASHRSSAAGGVRTAVFRTGTECAATRAAAATVRMSPLPGSNRTQSMRARYLFLPPAPTFIFPPFILLGLHSLSAIGAELRSSSVHSRRPPDLTASALASRQTLPPAVRARRL